MDALNRKLKGKTVHCFKEPISNLKVKYLK